MTQAAILIQSKFRSYYEQKKFQQSRRAAMLIQQYYRSYKECGKRRQNRRAATIVQQKLRSSLLTKKQDQAARKIMRFLRRCRHRVKELKKAKELEDTQQHPVAMWHCFSDCFHFLFLAETCNNNNKNTHCSSGNTSCRILTVMFWSLHLHFHGQLLICSARHLGTQSSVGSWGKQKTPGGNCELLHSPRRKKRLIILFI